MADLPRSLELCGVVLAGYRQLIRRVHFPEMNLIVTGQIRRRVGHVCIPSDTDEGGMYDDNNGVHRHVLLS